MEGGDEEGRDRWFLFKLTRSEHSVAPLKVKNEERDCVQSLWETRERLSKFICTQTDDKPTRHRSTSSRFI
jgi:hypothetical protein